MNIVFVHNALQSFVRTDRDILASAHNVVEINLARRQNVLQLPGAMMGADLLVVWFAGLHSVPSVLCAWMAHRPSIAVVGGYDTAHEPEIGYGHMGHPWKRHLVRWVCSRASLLITNSETSAAELRRTTGTTTPVLPMYLGFPPMPPVNVNRERRALTVGTVNVGNLTRKGHGVFARAATLLPDVQFVLAGRWEDGTTRTLQRDAPANLQVLPRLSLAELQSQFARAGVYVQASKHETFGAAVAEAMQGGCIPVVSRRGSLPEIVGDVGIYVDEDSEASVAAGIERGLACDEDCRQGCRRRVAARFPLELRRARFLAAVDAVVAHRPVVLPAE